MMSQKRNGQLVKSPEWWKHLRKYYKRVFWKKERKAESKDISNRRFRDGG